MVTRERILKLVSSQGYKPLKIRELSRKLSIPDSEYGSFRNAIREMVREGLLLKLRGGRYGKIADIEGGVGIFYARRGKGGFIIPEGGGMPMEASSGGIRQCVHGDKVIYRLSKSRRSGKPAGVRIIKILKRPGTTIVGTSRLLRRKVHLCPDDLRYPQLIPVDGTRSVEAADGQKVVAHIDAADGGDFELECRITEVLGYPGEPHLDIEALIHSYGLSSVFPSDVDKEIKKIPKRVPRSEIGNRVDFRDTVTVTIDPENAKDYDDAVSIRNLRNGCFELGVHIADVSYYVDELTAIDMEALQRGTSVYLVDRVIPMLPEVLSNNYCSLRPGVDRLTVSCIMIVNDKGRVISTEVVNSVIRSAARLTYNQVQKYFDTGNGFTRKPVIGKILKEMLILSRLLKERRYKKGSLDFDLPEPLVSLDEKGNVIDIAIYPRYDSHRLIEEFMLLANIEVAKIAKSNRLPVLYRVHDEPDPEKIANFAENLKEFGYNFSFKGEITAKKLQRVITTVEGRTEEKLVNELLLRSMKKAVYQSHNIGHFALGFPVYTHFTSPIRRYPDLLVHRIIKGFIERKLTKGDIDKYNESLESIGEICSEREKLAEKVERESIKVKTIQYISDRIGEVLKGTISGIVGAGFFVELEDIFIDGFVRFGDLRDDYYYYDKTRHRAIGRRSGKIYRLGDEIEVSISRVDIESRRVDLSILEKPRTKKHLRKTMR